jgi:hypothetical protein
MTRAETRFRLSAKWTSPFKLAGASVQSPTGSRGVRISDSNGSNAGYTKFQGSVKGTGYPLHSPASPSLPPVHHRVPSHFNCTLPLIRTSQPRVLVAQVIICFFFIDWACSITLGNTTRFVHIIGYLLREGQWLWTSTDPLQFISCLW